MIGAIPLISSAVSMLPSSDTTATTAKAAAAQGADFSHVMAKVSNETVDSLKKAEQMSVDGIQGKQNIQNVVQAVMNAQENLQAALAIRDKAVSALTDITHMSI